MLKIGIGYLLLLSQFIIVKPVLSATCLSTPDAFTSYMDKSFTVTTDPSSSVSIVVTMDASGTGIFTATTPISITSDASGIATFSGYFDKIGQYNVAITCGASTGSASITVNAPIIYSYSLPNVNFI